MKVETIFFFANGNVAACDEGGKQIAELQTSWLLTVLERMRANGGEIDESCEIMLPNSKHARLIRLGGGEWNWNVE